MGRKIKITESKLKQIISESVKRILKESSNLGEDKNKYSAYVIKDSNGAILYNYEVFPGDFWRDVLNEAIEDAKELAKTHNFGTFYVYGCLNNTYSDDTLVFNTDDLKYN